jgi:hypothetical protein
MTRLAPSLVLAAFGVTALPAGEAVADDTFAAIAFNKQTGATGYGYRSTSRAGAEERALQECGRGCEIVAWVRNQCLSLATGRGHGYGYAISTDDANAMERAVEECEKRTGSCEVNTTICSARLPGG